jgi:hypothetical protein
MPLLRLRLSAQAVDANLPEVYLQVFGILRSFSVLDSRATRLGRAALEIARQVGASREVLP